jgi:hypothetical protein
MTDHDEIQVLLEGYVDETLDRPTRRLVDSHLADCGKCRAILDDVAPVDLSAMHTPRVDERHLRRSVRRAMRRTVFDAVLMLLAVWMAAWLVAALIVQPLAVNRGGRATAAAQATIDAAVMYNPGAIVTDFSIQTAWLRRTFTAEIGLPVGSTLEPLGEVTTALGPVEFGHEDGGGVFPFVGSETAAGVLDTLDRLGDGTVATVGVWFDDPVTVDEAQALADSTETDTRVVWAGFVAAGGWPQSPTDVYGYPTCIDPGAGFDDSFLSATSASGSGGGLFSPSSVRSAQENVVRALDNLADHPRIAADLARFSEEPFESAGRYVESEGRVGTLVVTGPSQQVRAFVDENRFESGAVLAVEFYNWSTPLCGR